MRLRYLVLGILVVLALGAAIFVGLAWRSEIEPVAAQPVGSFDPETISRGEALALIGNCNSCHTRAGGEPYAGGVPFDTPFGTIYATNITPDPETGIGQWSQEAFRRAMHEGVRRDGRHLYPAFPYDHFTKLTDEDVQAIYAFLMTRKPVQAQAEANELSFPFNFRALIAGWKLLYFTPGRFQPAEDRDEAHNRGAYLTEAVAHCSSCHSPRNALGAERSDRYFDGGDAGTWHAPALNRNSPAPTPWTTEQLHTYLRTGFVERHGVAAGPMRPVVANLGAAPEEDVRAIARYVGSILEPATADRRDRAEQLLSQIEERKPVLWQTAAAEATGRADSQSDAAGAILYAGTCAMCHEPIGLRFSASGIPLSISKVIALPDPRNLINITLHGIEAPPRAPHARMPGFANALTDAQIASLVNYLRSAFSDQPAWEDVEGHVSRARRHAR